jgi:ADP-ribose pyrophosphatase
MKGWQTLSRRVALRRGKWLTVEDHSVRLPGGAVIEQWPWIVTPEFVNVAARTAEGQFLFFRQGKYALDRETLAPVGGYLEEGEDPLAGAQRELREETGCEAAEWTPLGRYILDANRGVSTGHFFLARGVRKVGEPVRGDELEDQQLVLLGRAEVEAALDRGEFAVLTWAAVVALALRRIDQG